jgi:hypothetical protein
MAVTQRSTKPQKPFATHQKNNINKALAKRCGIGARRGSPLMMKYRWLTGWPKTTN